MSDFLFPNSVEMSEKDLEVTILHLTDYTQCVRIIRSLSKLVTINSRFLYFRTSAAALNLTLFLPPDGLLSDRPVLPL